MEKSLPNFRTRQNRSSFLRKASFLVVFFLFLGMTNSFASHFRHGNISWRVVSGRTIEFKITQAWRYTAFYPNLGTKINYIDYLNFGDGTGSSFDLNVTAINTVEDWFYGEATVTKTYNSDGNFNAFFSSCCKISDMQNNADGYWRVETNVTVGNNNNSPVSTLPAIVNLPINQANASFKLPVIDPDGDALSFRLATYDEMLGYNPSGFNVNASTGVVTFNTNGTYVGAKYNAAIVITDSKGAKSIVDFIVKITNQSTPPTFNYASTPVNGTVLQVSPGQNVSFNVSATDTDPGDVVTLQAVGIPPGAVFTPNLPRTSNPVNTSFSWTPGTNNLGTNVINLIAQDAQGVQTNTSVTILVSMKPMFDVPPTPAASTFTFVNPGQAISQLIQVSDPDPNDLVQVIGISGIAGASLSTLPSVAGNPTTTNLIWNPQVTQWGVNTVVLTAKDTYGDQTNHKFNYVVNSIPQIVSAQGDVSLVAGQTFTYTFKATDADLPFGDKLEVTAGFHHQNQLPAWLSFTDHGDGTATLSGTPQITDAGTSPIQLVAEDTYHHNGGIASQAFNITVIPCNTALNASVSKVSCPAGNDGAIDLTVSGGVAPFIFNWSNGATTEDLSDLTAGVYTVVVTDKNNCTETIAVTVEANPDTTSPTIEKPATLVVSAEPNKCGASVQLTLASATDNCGIASLTSDAPAFFPVGTTTVTWTATDVNGLSSTITQDVTVTDNEKPVVATKNLTVQLDATGNASITAAQIDNNSADNCGIATYSLSNATFSCSNVGANTVTLTVTDIHGNESSADATVTVKDEVAPVALAKNVSITLVNGSASVLASDIDNGSNDACGIQSLALSKTSFDCSDLGNNAVVLTVTDKNGNVSTATATVKVIGVKPVASIAVSRTDNTFTGLDSKTIALGYGAQKLTLTASNSTSAVNASTFAWSPASGLSSTNSANPVFTPSAAGTYTFKVLVTNEYGCSATTSVTINVIDVRCGTKNDKVLVCHKTGSAKNPWNQICISPNAVAAHLANGSTLGSCGSSTSSIMASTLESGLSLTNTGLVSSVNSLTAYPNPLTSTTTVTFSLISEQKNVTLGIYDVKGSKVATIYSGKAEANKEYNFKFDGATVPAGVYFFRLTGDGGVALNFKAIVTP